MSKINEAEIIGEFLASKGASSIRELDKESMQELAKRLGDERKLNQILENFAKIRDNLADLNSQFPATREFLEARGLKHVNELDKDGLKELEDYLRNKLSQLVH